MNLLKGSYADIDKNVCNVREKNKHVWKQK